MPHENVVFFYVKPRMRWEKGESNHIRFEWCKTKVSPQFNWYFRHFCIVIISIALFYVRISISFTHTCVGQWIFGFVVTKFEFYCFFSLLCLSSNPFQLFFGMENLELLAFCFDLGKYVSIKRKRSTQIQMWFEHNKTFIVFVFYHFITKEENSNERLRTNFGTDSLSKRFFSCVGYLLKFYTHIQKKV